MSSSFTGDDGYRYEQFVPNGPFIKSKYPPQPPAPEAAASGEPLDRQLDDIASLLTDDISIARNEARERLKELIAAAVQAAQVELLNKAKDSVYFTLNRSAYKALEALLDGDGEKQGEMRGIYER